jgi:hypothetical protein
MRHITTDGKAWTSRSRGGKGEDPADPGMAARGPGAGGRDREVPKGTSSPWVGGGGRAVSQKDGAQRLWLEAPVLHSGSLFFLGLLTKGLARQKSKSGNSYFYCNGRGKLFENTHR